MLFSRNKSLSIDPDQFIHDNSFLILLYHQLCPQTEGPPAPKADAGSDEVVPSRLDLRVGKITKVEQVGVHCTWHHCYNW